MKNIFLKIFIIFAFILNLSILPSFAEFLDINSVTFDNSGSFMSLNSHDNLNYPFTKTPQLIIDEENNKAYIELTPTRINNNKSFIINSNEIAEIELNQVSTNPDTTRITIKYKQDYNPKNITINRLHNTIFIRFKNTQMTNYYFQEVYKESGTNLFYEKIDIQQKIQSQKNIIGEINSAFTNQLSETDNQDYVLSKKNLILKTKYYISSLTIKGETPILKGIGSYTLSKPIYLSNPNRVAFDIKNTVVNPLLRNRDIPFGNASIKIGQFDQNTARVVITANSPEVYLPVIYSDSQKLGFLDTSNTSPLNMYNTISDMNAIKQEKSGENNYSAKFSFSNPITFGLLRKQDKIEISLFNINSYYSGAISSELRNTPFENMEVSSINSGGAKLSIPITNPSDQYDIFLGADGKTLRIRIITAEKYISKEKPVTEEIKIIPEPPQRTDNKKYVVIDAGHGGSDCGALRNGINEKDITLDIAKRVQTQLEKKGYVVAMTRTDDSYISLQDRVDYSELFNPDIFISIHVNSSNSDTPSGIETHYYKDDSLKLAKYMHASLLNNINAKDRGLFKSKFYVINHTTAPAILIETGFLSNTSERAQLVTENRKNATAKAIVEGIDDYFKK